MADPAHAAGAEVAHAVPTALGIDPTGWVALAMIAVFLIMLRMKVPAMVAAALDAKIAGIRGQLDDAARLRAEAEALKAEYEAKLAETARHAEEVKHGAEDEARHIVERAKADAKALIARRAKSAEEKIAAAERNAVAELRAAAANAAAASARGLIAAKHDAVADQPLVDQAISQI
ncbi:MAG: F0F1 ATP synthase subunit B [Novosphingobium sp.]